MLWILWVYWIVITFLMQKERKRTLLGMLVLITISSSNLIIQLGNIAINITSIILLLISVCFLVRCQHSIYLLFASLFIAHIYAGLRFWEIVSPIWVFIPRVLLYTCVFFVLIQLFFKRSNDQLYVSFTSIIGGEIIYSLVIHRLGWEVIIGDATLLLLLCFLTSGILIVQLCQEIKKRLKDILRTRIVSEEVK